MQRITVKPAPGRQVPVPEHGFRLLAEAGESVPLDAYWQRRINAGDVLVFKQTKGAATK